MNGMTHRPRRPGAIGTGFARFAIVTMFGAATLAQSALAADSNPARLMVRETTEALVAVVEQSRKDGQPDYPVIRREVNRLLVPHLDLDGAARVALGGHWKKATPAQREQFSEALGKLLLGTYTTALAGSADATIEFLDGGGDTETSATVRTRISPPGASAMHVDYRMHRRDDRWQVYDVVIEGVSLMRSYRSSFNAEIRRSGIEGLTKKIEAKISASDEA